VAGGLVTPVCFLHTTFFVCRCRSAAIGLARISRHPGGWNQCLRVPSFPQKLREAKVHSEAETRAMMRGLLDQAMENSEALLTLGSLEEFLQVRGPPANCAIFG